ncbi:MAG: PIG-L deacetylase family protein [bacterium]
MNRTEGFRSPLLGFGMVRADVGEIVVETDQPGQPHRGKVFAAVHAHLDDVPRYAAGLCAKLIREGYTGYLIRTTNDEKCGGQTTAHNILSNEQEHFKVAAAIGCKDVFELYYQNHEMDAISSLDIRGRLIFLFRFLKVDTVISFSPWGHGEENPDHWVTARAVEEAALDVRDAERFP